MSPLDRDLVRRKLALIARNLQDLALVEGISLEACRADRFRQKGTERLLQEVIEAAADTNLHLLRTAGAATPPDYFESFLELGRHPIVPQALAERLAPAAGLRNRIVHEYDDLDDAIVLKAVHSARHEFPTYIAAVERYLARQD